MGQQMSVRHAFSSVVSWRPTRLPSDRVSTDLLELRDLTATPTGEASWPSLPLPDSPGWSGPRSPPNWATGASTVARLTRGW
jgi:hypothetical protein